MSFNRFHTVRCAINTKSHRANCTCGATEQWQRKKITELREKLVKVEITNYERSSLKSR